MYPNQKIFTDVAELVDALGLGSSNFGCESSSLSIRNFYLIRFTSLIILELI